MPGHDGARVGYVLKMYPRLAETFILNEILAHESAGLDLEIFSLRPPTDGCFHRELGRVRAVARYLPGPSVRAELLWSGLCQAQRRWPAADLLDLAEGEEAETVHQGIVLAQEVEERGITHLHAHFATAATSVCRIASLLTRVPYSFTAHAKDIYCDGTVVEGDLRRKLRDAASVVTVSDYNLEHLRSRFGDDAKRVRRIYNGLDLQELCYAPPEGRPPVVVGVGRLVEKKGFSDLLDAMAILRRRGKRFRCAIIGDGVLRGALAEQVQRLDLAEDVELAGALPRGEVYRRMASAAALAAPCVVASDGNRDGLPTVLLEAMALGTPCVSTPVTGIPELVRDGETGLITGERDPGALADALERLLEDERLARGLAASARRLVEAEFDIDRNSVALREIFRARAPARGAVGVR
jgi:glycosyltransferase involved in cell wall biosynthesis